ncbi:uncharacterized protein E0L32_011125 [Thyridium curvatum]|uniref:Uncharacterized protein n=1 Tax=Thyridium curvatum TaxID=1093900 RepID=A0A507AS10_9PEZI|nr:uncharacterized protein E0L32_011125 [Thyridium curvatum]TPX06980.1 hypothetical protein E0L32_011125 [Thyridium curvatum]
MASIQPPTAANLKRKRAPADSQASSQPGIPSHLRDTINPRSHSQSTLRQLQAAGLSDQDVLPSEIVPGFPHRALPSYLFNQDDEDGSAEIPAEIDRAEQQEALGDNEDDDDGAESGKDHEDQDPATAARRRAEKRERGVKRALRAHERHLGVLTAILHRSLDAGDLPRAKRAFALLARSEVYGKAVDLRQDHLWAVGAEILMREGEGEQQQQGQEQQGGRSRGERWGSAANMPRVRAYYQDLILHHPYNRMFPRATSALDFWPALLGTELYNAWAEHGLALRRLEAEAEDWAAGGGPEAMDYSEDDDDSAGRGGQNDDRVPKMGPWEARLREAKDSVRTETMAMVGDIARRLDGLMENPPYSTSHEMLRLRGMVSLYLSDLVMAPAPRSAREDRDGRVEREDEREKAKDAFRKIIKERGEVEEWIEHFVYPERMEDDEDEETIPVFSSLPIR